MVRLIIFIVVQKKQVDLYLRFFFFFLSFFFFAGLLFWWKKKKTHWEINISPDVFFLILKDKFLQVVYFKTLKRMAKGSRQAVVEPPPCCYLWTCFFGILGAGQAQFYQGLWRAPLGLRSIFLRGDPVRILQLPPGSRQYNELPWLLLQSTFLA